MLMTLTSLMSVAISIPLSTSKQKSLNLEGEKKDSVQPRFKVKPTTVQNEKDILHRSGDLKDPENLKSEVFYDE